MLGDVGDDAVMELIEEAWAEIDRGIAVLGGRQVYDGERCEEDFADLAAKQRRSVLFTADG